MLKEFKEFISRGSVIDLAIGVIIGAAFGKIVESLVNDIIMPPIGLMLGGVDFGNMFINLSSTPYATLKAAKEAGAPTINYGTFINTVITFLIVAFVVFLVVRSINRTRQPAAAPAAPAAPTTTECPYCLSSIPLKATRCAHCTADLGAPIGVRAAALGG